MSQLEYKVMQLQLAEQVRTNELLQELISLQKPKETQQPTKEVVSNKTRNTRGRKTQ